MPKIEVRHKTPYATYRRAGLVLRKRWETVEVEEDTLAVLRADSWLEVKETKDPPEETPLPEGWTAEKGKGSWWLLIDPDGTEHKINGGKTAAQALAKLESDETPAE